MVPTRRHSLRTIGQAAFALLWAVGLILAMAGLVLAAGPDPMPRVWADERSCTVNGQGQCTVAHGLGSVPVSIVVTPKSAASYGLVVVSTTATTVTVRATVSNRVIVFFAIAAGPGIAPPPTTTTTAPPPTTTTTTAPPPPPHGFPSPANTGVPAGTLFADTRGLYYARTTGEVLDRIHFTDSLVIEASGVIVTNSQIDDTVLISGPNHSVTVSDSTIGPAVCGTPAWSSGMSTDDATGSYTSLRNHVRGHSDGFQAGGTNMRVEDTFVDLCTTTGDHGDGVQDYPFANGMVLNHNTFDEKGEPGQNSPVFMSGGGHGGPVSTNITITNNLGLGGAYTFYLWPGAETWIVTGNRAVTDVGTFGPYITSGRCAQVTEWADNDVVTVDNNYAITATLADNVPCPN